MVYLTTVTGETIEVKDWNIQTDYITKMRCEINKIQSIVMEGFEAYLRLFENVKGVNCSFEITSKIILLGKVGNTVARIDLNLQSGKVEYQKLPLQIAYNGKPLNPTMWKKGVFSIPKIYSVNN